MDELLDADCVIDALFEKGIFTKKLWKLDKVTASSYDVSFEFADSARIAGFTIFIKGTYHCIGITALRNHSRRFSIPVNDIILRCAV
ncbi:MAG: hypothetical protein LBE14_05455 [Treponema sp.]|jgi:hypothetical protein|nr:hypothetical protein [Treponema sp.]